MKRGRGHQSRNKRRQSKHKKHTRHHKKQQGGFGPGAGPVGYAWTPDAATWPGVLAANGGDTKGITMSNHLPLSPNGIAVGGVDIAVLVGFKGGSRKSRKSHKSHKKHGSRKGGRRHKKARHIRRGATMVDSAHRSSSTSVAI